jgi:hypothetical protein
MKRGLVDTVRIHSVDNLSDVSRKKQLQSKEERRDLTQLKSLNVRSGKGNRTEKKRRITIWRTIGKNRKYQTKEN